MDPGVAVPMVACNALVKKHLLVHQCSGASDGGEARPSPICNLMNCFDQRGSLQSLALVNDNDEVFPDDLADNVDFVHTVQKQNIF